MSLSSISKEQSKLAFKAHRKLIRAKSRPSSSLGSNYNKIDLSGRSASKKRSSLINNLPLPFRLPIYLTLYAISLLLTVVVLSPITLLADEAIRLASTSPGGAVALEAAVREGYFKEEGLEVEAIALTAAEFGKKIANGEILGGEFNHLGLTLALDNVPLVYTGGLYSGFVEIVGPSDTQNTVKNNKKSGSRLTLAVQDLGSGASVAAARYFRAKGIDPDTDITWLEANNLTEALKTHKADALARWELKRVQGGHGHQPSHESHHKHEGQAGHTQGQAGSHESHSKQEGQADHTHGQSGTHEHKHIVKKESHQSTAHEQSLSDESLEIIFSASASLPQHDPDDKNVNPHAKHTSAHHLFESFVVIEANLVKKDPETAAAITRALIRGARWTGENPGQAVLLGTEKGIWKDRVTDPANEIDRYMWMPGVSHAKEHLKYYIHEGIKRGVFPADLDENEFFKKIFVQVLPDLG
jgi:ABC-type nitrate/sulfonate/bicarbonate transport system substrate-binding protein